MTQIFNMTNNNINDEQICLAAKVINKGGVVAFPTETVYGLGADGFNESAVAKIFSAKGRPSDNPLILHISQKSMLSGIAREIPPIAEQLMNMFWPGPLTLIFKKTLHIPKKVTGNLDTVAVRMPSNKIARKLIESAGVPIAAPSANISGRPSPTKAQHVIEDLKDKVDIIIASDNSEIGLESTVLDLTDSIPVLLRPGSITLNQLRSVLGQVDVDPSLLEKKNIFKPKAPGMKYKHYSPKAPLKIVQGEQSKVIEKINELSSIYRFEGKKVGIIATNDTKDKYKADMVFNLGNRCKPLEITNNLFDILRACDTYSIDSILSEGFSTDGIEMAIMNRLVKAAGYDILQV